MDLSSFPAPTWWLTHINLFFNLKRKKVWETARTGGTFENTISLLACAGKERKRESGDIFSFDYYTENLRKKKR